jgi:hypothetical protein
MTGWCYNKPNKRNMKGILVYHNLDV